MQKVKMKQMVNLSNVQVEIEEGLYISVSGEVGRCNENLNEEDEGGKFHSVGSFLAHILDTEIEPNFSLVADEIDGDSHVLVETIDDDLFFGQRIALLSRLEVDHPYQNQGIGTSALEEVIHFLDKGMRVDGIALTASPLDKGLTEGEKKQRVKQLTAFYKRFGFKTVEKNHLFLPIY